MRTEWGDNYEGRPQSREMFWVNGIAVKLISKYGLALIYIYKHLYSIKLALRRKLIAMIMPVKIL